jgi:hypothetical protein
MIYPVATLYRKGWLADSTLAVQRALIMARAMGANARLGSVEPSDYC